VIIWNHFSSELQCAIRFETSEHSRRPNKNNKMSSDMGSVSAGPKFTNYSLSETIEEFFVAVRGI